MSTSLGSFQIELQLIYCFHHQSVKPNPTILCPSLRFSDNIDSIIFLLIFFAFNFQKINLSTL